MSASRAPRRHLVPGSGDLTSQVAVDLSDRSTDRVVDEDSDALAEAERRWPVARERFLSVEGPPLSSLEMSGVLGTDDRGVEIARQQGSIVGVPDGTGALVYPRWQLGAAGPLPGLREVLAALRDDDPWTLVIFVLSPNARLGDETPLKALRRGDVSDVLRAASAYGEHGAA